MLHPLNTAITRISPAKSGTEFVSDGENGIKSANGGMKSSVVTITITFGEAVSNARLSFDYKVSSEARYDYLSVNGSTEKTLSGEIDWTNYSQTVTAGSVVTLAYVKDSSGDRGSDAFGQKLCAAEPWHGHV